MSYTNAKRVTYSRIVAGATTATWYLAAPSGCNKFRVVDINASVTIAFVGTSTPAILGVGVAGNVNCAGYINFGSASTPAPVNSAVGLDTYVKAGVNPLYGCLDLSGTSNTITTPIVVPEVAGPALITLTASTGGTPAGAANVDVTLDWF